jgi:hypothetical protein
MNERASLADITFTENGHVDVAQLNALYRLIGWDSHNRHTEAETTEMLRVSHYYIAAHRPRAPWWDLRVSVATHTLPRC